MGNRVRGFGDLRFRNALEENLFFAKKDFCQMYRYICPICGKPYFLKKNFLECCRESREYREEVRRNGSGGGGPRGCGSDAPSYTGPSPYPGGPSGPAGFVPGAEYGGHYMGGSPYPGGPHGPAGQVPNSGFVGPGPDGRYR